MNHKTDTRTFEEKKELTFCREYISIMFKMLRSETPEDAWSNLRALQELEEFADKLGKIVFVKIKLLQK